MGALDGQRHQRGAAAVTCDPIERPDGRGHVFHASDQLSIGLSRVKQEVLDASVDGGLGGAELLKLGEPKGKAGPLHINRAIAPASTKVLSLSSISLGLALANKHPAYSAKWGYCYGLTNCELFYSNHILRSQSFVALDPELPAKLRHRKMTAPRQTHKLLFLIHRSNIFPRHLPSEMCNLCPRSTCNPCLGSYHAFRGHFKAVASN